MEDITSTPEIPIKWARRFFTFWGGQVISLTGSSLVQFALVWWLTSTTGSATVLATATLIAILPEIILSPFSGTLVDRWNRKRIMIVADSMIAIATLVLMLLFAIGRQSLWAVYAILLIRSIGSTFHAPAESASIALMVPKEHLARIAGLNQTLGGILSILAPPLGALLIGFFPIQFILAIDVSTAAIAISILVFIAIPRPPSQLAQADGRTGRTSYWQDLRAGWAYIVAWPGLMGVILLAMAVNFVMRPATSLSPLMITQEYQGGVMQLGMADALLGVGIILGGILLGAWGGFKRRMATCLLGIAGMGTAILVFGLFPSAWFLAALASLFLLGIMDALANGPLEAILQAAVAPDMQGRVFSFLIAGARAMSPLSLLAAGPIADWLGVRSWYIIGGSACILLAVVALFIPAIVNIDASQQSQPAAAQTE